MEVPVSLPQRKSLKNRTNILQSSPDVKEANSCKIHIIFDYTSKSSTVAVVNIP